MFFICFMLQPCFCVTSQTPTVGICQHRSRENEEKESRGGGGYFHLLSGQRVRNVWFDQRSFNFLLYPLMICPPVSFSSPILRLPYSHKQMCYMWMHPPLEPPFISPSSSSVTFSPCVCFPVPLLPQHLCLRRVSQLLVFEVLQFN